MGHGKPSDAERGVLGAWIRHGLLAKGWTAKDLQERLAQQGYTVAINTVQQWALGNTSPAHSRIPLIEAVLERPAPKEPEADTLRVVAALERQTQQMIALTDELRRLVSLLEPEGLARTSRGLARAALEAGLGPAGGDQPDTLPPRLRRRSPER